MTIDTILLGPGGGKCFTYLGALKALVNNKRIDLSDINTWGGVSAGAVVATLFYIGMRLPEATEFVINVAFEKIGDPLQEELLFDDYGLNDGGKFCFFLTELFTEIVGKPDPTFSELHTFSGQKTLKIQVTNLSRYQSEILTHATHPDMSVVTALRMSVSVPFVFTPVVWNNQLYVDGGLIRACLQPTKKEGTLSLRVHSEVKPSGEDPIPPSLVEYAIEVTRCFLFLHDTRLSMTTTHAELDITLSVEGDMLLFPDEMTRKELVKIGFDQTSRYLLDTPEGETDGQEGQPERDGQEGHDGCSAPDGPITREAGPSHLLDSEQTRDLDGEETEEVEGEVHDVQEHAGITSHVKEEDCCADEDDCQGNECAPQDMCVVDGSVNDPSNNQEGINDLELGDESKSGVLESDGPYLPRDLSIETSHPA